MRFPKKRTGRRTALVRGVHAVSHAAPHCATSSCSASELALEPATTYSFKNALGRGANQRTRHPPRATNPANPRKQSTNTHTPRGSCGLVPRTDGRWDVLVEGEGGVGEGGGAFSGISAARPRAALRVALTASAVATCASPRTKWRSPRRFTPRRCAGCPPSRASLRSRRSGSHTTGRSTAGRRTSTCCTRLCPRRSSRPRLGGSRPRCSRCPRSA